MGDKRRLHRRSLFRPRVVLKLRRLGRDEGMTSTQGLKRQAHPPRPRGITRTRHRGALFAG